MKFILAYTKVSDRDKKYITLASVDEARADYLLKGYVLLANAIHELPASNLVKTQVKSILDSGRDYNKEKLKQLIFGDNSKEIELLVMEDIDLGFDIDGNSTTLRFPEEYCDGDKLDIVIVKKELDAEQENFIKKEKRTILKYELAGKKYKRHSLNGKYYSFVSGEEEYGDNLANYAVIMNWKFKEKAVQLGDVYLYNCYFHWVDSLKIRHLYGTLCLINRCNADFLYISLSRIRVLDYSVIYMHNIHKCHINCAMNSNIHLYNFDELVISSCQESNIHFHEYVESGKLTKRSNINFIRFMRVRLFLYAGIDIDELKSILYTIALVEGARSHIEVYINEKFRSEIDSKYDNIVEYIPERI